MNFIDLFAGCGGLSEGFIKAGYEPIAHVEMCPDASNTLKTRIAYHYLSQNQKVNYYFEYLKLKISREELWKYIPQQLLHSVINKEIANKTKHDIFKQINELSNGKKIDLIIGGPPCQAYSIVGRSRDAKGMKWDRRNFLFRFYAEFIKKYKPTFFIFENVLGILTAGNRKYFKEMLEIFSELGYSVDWKILNAENYGVLQKRRRVIIIGRRGKSKFTFPAIEEIRKNWEIKKDLFSDLPFLSPGQELHVCKYTKSATKYLKNTGIRNGFDHTTQHITRNHNERDLEIYAIAVNKWLKEKKRLNYSDLPKRLQSHNNKESFLDRYKVIDSFGYSHTVVAHIAKDGHYYIYPDINQIRSISVREAARIQSFPDDYYFEGGRTAAFKQIGNAVPPLMAEKIALALRNLLQST